MVINNALNNQLSTVTGLFGLKNPSYKRYAARNMATTDIDIYTVPAGKKVFLAAFYAINTSNAIQMQIKISGIYYRLTGGSITPSKQNTPFCLFLAGETISYNYAGGVTNPTVYASYIEFDDDTPITRPLLTSFVAGDNTLYTCPTGYQAIPINLETSFAYLPGSLNNKPFINCNSLLNYFNTSGATRTLTIYSVPNGGSPSSTNATWSGTRINNAQPVDGVNIFSFPIMTAGDSCVINTDSNASGQIAWLTLWERKL